MQTAIPGITKVVDSNGTTQFHSEKQYHTVPEIVREYMDTDVKEGQPPVRMYECKGDRHFIADTYDFNFKVCAGPVKAKGYRDPNYNYRGGLNG